MRKDRRGALVLALALASCAAPVEPTPDARGAGDGLAGGSALVPVLRDAGLRHGVPAGVLAAIAWAASRGSMRGGAPSVDGGYGLLDLHEGTTLPRAAEVTGLGQDQLVGDAAANVEGGAAVLGALLRGGRASIDDAIAEYGSRALADEVRRALSTGVSFHDDDGGEVVVAPRPLPAPRLGAHEEYARPDYPDAQWVGPACSYTNSSRGPADIWGIVIHTCQGGFAGCWSWLVGCHDVSAHYVVRSSDGHVVQAVEGSDVAWHDACNNSHTIGIEHEGFVGDPDRWFTDEMYCGSAELVRWLCDRYDIPCDRDHVYGHGEAPDCSDHTDPGNGWDWGKFMRYVREGCRCTPAPEACNGRDDDCDGQTDEGVQNRCGACGPEPAETCNCADDDCNGKVDDGACPEVARATDASYPRLLPRGGRAPAWVVLTNEGTDPWRAGDVVLRVQGERTDLGGLEGAWPAYDVPARLEHDVAPGASARLDFTLEAAADAPLGPRTVVLAAAHAGGDVLRGPCDGGGEATFTLEVVEAARPTRASSGGALQTSCAAVPGRGGDGGAVLLGLLASALIAARRRSPHPDPLPRCGRGPAFAGARGAVLVAALVAAACVADEHVQPPAALVPFVEAPGAVPVDDSRSRDVAFADVDADGDPDALVAVREGPSRLYVNDGLGHLALAPLPLAAMDAIGLAVGDVDGDGVLDAYVAVYAQTQDRLLLGDGRGGFRDATAEWLPADAASDHGVALGDVDGDGDLDAIVAAYGEDAAGHRQERLYVNAGTRFEDRTAGRLPPADDTTPSVALADLDGDRDLDLVACNDGEEDRHLRLLVNDGAGVFAEAPAGAMPDQAERCRRVLAGDLDGDGDADVLAVGRGQDRVYVNDGAAHFLDQTEAALPVDATTGIGAWLGDLDGDADLDLVVATDGGQDRLYLNDGAGRFVDATLLLPAGSARSVGVAVADVDADGDLDMLVTTETGGPDRLLVASDPWHEREDVP